MQLCTLWWCSHTHTHNWRIMMVKHFDELYGRNRIYNHHNITSPYERTLASISFKSRYRSDTHSQYAGVISLANACSLVGRRSISSNHLKRITRRTCGRCPTPTTDHRHWLCHAINGFLILMHAALVSLFALRFNVIGATRDVWTIVAEGQHLNESLK